MTCPCLPGSNCAECDFQPGLGMSNDMDLGTPDFQAGDFQWQGHHPIDSPKPFMKMVGLALWLFVWEKKTFFCVFCFFPRLFQDHF